MPFASGISKSPTLLNASFNRLTKQGTGAIRLARLIYWMKVLKNCRSTTSGPALDEKYAGFGLYQFTRHQLTYGSAKNKRFTYSFFERFGGYYGGSLNEFRVQANYRPTAQFSLSACETWDRFRLPLPQGDFSVVLASFEGNYSFTRFLTFTSFIQMDTSNTQAVSANVRLSGINSGRTATSTSSTTWARNSPASRRPILRKRVKPVSPSNGPTPSPHEFQLRDVVRILWAWYMNFVTRLARTLARTRVVLYNLISSLI
jgi:hypothetical protein